MIQKRFLLILAATLFIISISSVVYSPVINNGFIAMDDSYYVTDNDMIKDLSVDNFFDFFHTKVAGNVQPLTMLSLSVDYYFWELDATAYHIHNVILHILNALLVFLFIYLLSKRKIFLAFFTSILFAIHPMHVESVAWISERKDVLYAFYYIAGLITYLLYKDKRKANYLVYTYILFALSLLSKPTAVSFPIVLIVLDYYFDGKFTFKQVYSKWVMFILSLIFGLINLKSQGVTSPYHSDFEIFKKLIYSSYNIIFYVRSFFIPTQLSMYHEIPIITPLFYYISTFIILLVFLYTIYAIIKKKHKLFVFGLLFFVSTIFLTLHIVAFSSAIVAERYTYIPYIGLSFSFLFWAFYKKDGSFKHIFNKPYLTLMLSFSIIIIFSFMSYSYIKKDWKNSETLWTNSIKYCPNSRIAYDARSNYYLLDSLPEKAIKDIKASIKLLPNGSYSSLSLAYYYYYTNKFDSVFIIANSRKNDFLYKGEYTKLRGMTYVKKKNYYAALLCYDSLIVNKPNNYEYREERAKINTKLKLYHEAIEDYSVMLSLKPKAEKNKINIGIAYLNLKKYKKAILQFESIKSSDIKTSKYYKILSNLYSLIGDSITADKISKKIINK